MKENMIKRNPLIPLMNEGLGELKCRRHFVPKTTWEYLYSEEARPVLEAIQKAQDVIHY